MYLDGILDRFVAQNLHSRLVLTMGDFLNNLGKGDVLAFLCICLALVGFIIYKPLWQKVGWAALLPLSASGVIVQGLKHLFGRARPQMNLAEFHFIGPNLIKNGFDSFPSGHASAAFALATFFSAFFPQARVWLYCLAACISIVGRVFHRHHFFTDVAAGAAVGTGIGLFFVALLKQWARAPETKSQDSRFRDNYGTQEIFLTQPDSEGSAGVRAAIFKDISLLILLSGTILFTGITASALWDRDETEYAQAIVEMQNNHEWMIPTLEGFPFIEKPILMYWIVRASFLTFGANEFAARFPSALFGIFTVLLVYFLGRTISDRNKAFKSALALSTCFLFTGTFRLLLTDPFFIFFSSLVFYFYILAELSPKNKTCYIVAQGTALGLSLLCKGPIGYYPLPILMLYETLNHRRFPLTRRFAVVAVLGTLLAAPWFIYSFQRQAGATAAFFLYDNLLRFLQGTEGHTGPMIYYTPTLLLGLFPWSFLLISAFFADWRKRSEALRGLPLLFFLWAVCLFGFFSLCSNKLPHYIAPALIPLSLWTRWGEETGSISKPWVGLWTRSLSFLLLFAPLTLLIFRPNYFSIRLMIPFALLTAWLGSGPLRFDRIAAGTICFYVSFALISLPWIERFRVMKPLGLAIAQRVPAQARLIGFNLSEPSLFFYGKRLFEKVENESLDKLLSEVAPTYILIHESKLKQELPKSPYVLVHRQEGFAENGGEMSVMLIANLAKEKN